jgi:hypothetical protein
MDYIHSVLTSKMRYLLIDAYNVICATDALREVMQGKLDTARDQLAEIVRSIHDAEAVHVALVLDSRNDKLEVATSLQSKDFRIPLRACRLDCRRSDRAYGCPRQKSQRHERSQQ